MISRRDSATERGAQCVIRAYKYLLFGLVRVTVLCVTALLLHK